MPLHTHTHISDRSPWSICHNSCICCHSRLKILVASAGILLACQQFMYMVDSLCVSKHRL